jgi:carbamate kinase
MTVRHIAGMIEGGWKVVITHGSSPQVGFILRRSEIANRGNRVRPELKGPAILPGIHPPKGVPG